VTPRESSHEACQRAGRSLVVDVCICTPHGCPKACQARVKKPQDRNAGVWPVHLEHPYTTDDATLFLTMIHRDHRHVMAAAGQFSSNERLLHLGTAHEGN
jgi:hypothetical protein